MTRHIEVTLLTDWHIIPELTGTPKEGAKMLSGDARTSIIEQEAGRRGIPLSHDSRIVS